jgi:hypothetical protein
LCLRTEPSTSSNTQSHEQSNVMFAAVALTSLSTALPLLREIGGRWGKELLRAV